MSTKPTAKEIAADLGQLFNEMVDSFALEDLIGHFYGELRVRKDFHIHNMPGALTAEKIAILENAVKEFEDVYEAEKAEAEKMPLSWHEANRLRNLFEEMDDSFNPLPDERLEH